MISYYDLKRKIDNSDDWCRALRSRKGVYLITDKNTGKQYVGSAYGKDGIFGRWVVYLTSGYDKNFEKEIDTFKVCDYPLSGHKDNFKIDIFWYKILGYTWWMTDS